MKDSLFAQAPDALPQLPRGPVPSKPTQLPQPTGQISLPHGIKGLVEYPFTLTPSMIAGGLFLALCLACFVYWWLKVRTRKTTSEALVQVDPLVELQSAIAALTPSEPFSGKNAESYYFSLGFHFRGVMEHCCGFRATDLTVKELKKPVMNIPALNQQDKQNILEFLLRSDMIKFAESPSGLPEALRYHSEVTNWVRDLINYHRQSEFTENSDNANQ